MAFRVLVVDRFDLSALALLRGEPSVDVTWVPDPVPPDDLLASCEGLVIRSRTRIDEDLLNKAPKLRVVVTGTSGFDHIDFAALAKRGIVAMYTPGANAASACEMTWSLILACSRKIVEAHAAVKAGQWRRESLMGRELNDKTLGIVGLGRIGSRVARVGAAFGMKIVAFDPYKEDAHFSAVGAQRVSFDELLKLADVVTFHVPATDETRFMLSRERLKSMNRHAILINASRGTVVAERDLIYALNEKWIAACGLDVFEREPLPQDSPLLKFPQVVFSPHLGATTAEAFAAASREAAQKIISFATGGQTSDRLPPEEALYKAGFSAPKGKPTT
mgnify:CR=1 FL=1